VMRGDVTRVAREASSVRNAGSCPNRALINGSDMARS
jgi:hypothetical protein